MSDSSAPLIYLYGIVESSAPDPGDDLTGLDGRPVRLFREGALAAPISDVSPREYGDEVLNARLGDIGWVGERGLAHERVLDWFSERGPILPLSLFSLHHDEERIRQRLRAEAERSQAQLERLRGCREWRVKLWRKDAVVGENLDQLSPTLQALAAEIESAPPGKKYLLLRKRDAARVDELRRVSERVGQLVYEELRQIADRGAIVPPPRGLPETGRTLTLDAAWLVHGDRLAEFQQRLGELAGEFRPNGFDFEFTGPWPTYHFTDDEAA